MNDSECELLNLIGSLLISLESDPFYESHESHVLIGVANLYMEVLFHDVRLVYHVPIISQQGEVAGKLQVEIVRIAGEFPTDRMCESEDEESDDEDMPSGSVTCRVIIRQVRFLPLSVSETQN